MDKQHNTIRQRLPARFLACAICYLGISSIGCNDNPGEPEPTIALETVYANVPTNGMKQVAQVGDRKLINELRLTRSQTQNIFVVGADNIGQAVKVTHDVVFGSECGDLVRSDSKGRASVWVVVYFGQGHSNPPAWVIDSIERKKDKVKINFRAPEAESSTLDNSRFYYWIPLGKLLPGKYEIQLYNSKESASELSRRIIVLEKQSKKET